MIREGCVKQKRIFIALKLWRAYVECAVDGLVHRVAAPMQIRLREGPTLYVGVDADTDPSQAELVPVDGRIRRYPQLCILVAGGQGCEKITQRGVTLSGGIGRGGRPINGL